MDKISLDTRDRDREKESAERVRFLQAEWQQVRQLASSGARSRPVYMHYSVKLMCRQLRTRKFPGCLQSRLAGSVVRFSCNGVLRAF
jgi:hypothetical protein